MRNEEKQNNNRDFCYSCYRPKSSCMCEYTKPIATNTKFIILMHPKEFRKTKNGTGHFTHLNLSNSVVFIGIDFTENKEINKIVDDQSNNCYILYPDKNSIKLNTQSIKEDGKNNVIFIIDSTWACSKKILRVSKNLHHLPRLSFEHTKSSAFKIKTQPNAYCLSTIESTLCILELLNKHNIENTKNEQLESFLKPFDKMIQYQINRAVKENGGKVRYKKPYKNEIFNLVL